jgi:succinylglutamate desuccinylase
MSQPLAPIETRVQQSLARNGFEGVKVTHLGDGAITLELGNTPPESKPLLVAIVRTVTGVTSVSKI